MVKVEMSTVDPPARFDLFVRRGFFDKRTCEEIVAEMRLLGGDPATLYGQNSSSSVDQRVRKALRYTPARETVELVMRELLACQHDVEKHFGISLREREEPQFLHYRVGDFFVAHQDGNTGLIQLDSENRRVSVVIFLSQQADVPEDGDYCGGSLAFHDWRPGPNREEDLLVPGETGTLVAFRSETTHEVIPVTHGERFSIASWYR